MIELQELLIPFLAGLFPSLMAVIPVIITSVKNIKVNKNVTDLHNLFKNISLDNENNNILIDEALILMKSTTEYVDREIKEIYKVAKESIINDVDKLTHQAMEKSEKLVSVINTMQHETRIFIEQMKKQILDDLEKEITEIANNVLKVQEERQNQVSSE